MQDVVLFGNGQNAEVAYNSLTHDSPHRVVAFTVDRAYLKDATLFGLPVVAFEEIEQHFPPAAFGMLVSVSFRAVNRLRAEKFHQARAKGYQLIRYLSSRASTWPSLELGDNCTIGTNTIIVPYVKIGHNVTIAGGCIVGHHTVIEDHCYLAPGCVVSGSVRVGAYSLIGAGAVVRDRLTIATATVVGAGSVILEDTVERGVYLAQTGILLPITSDKLALG